MIELAYPWLMLLIVLPLLMRLVPAHRSRADAVRVPFFEEIVAAIDTRASRGAVVQQRRRVRLLLLLSTWLLLVIAVANPQWVGEPIERTTTTRDVMLAIDLSGSMDYVDFPDDDAKALQRLAAVKRVVAQFVSRRDGDRIGLVVFGSKAYLQLPFTTDLDAAGELVALTEVGMAGPKTAIGDAIGLAIRSFESSEVEERLLILLTDGNDTASTMTPLNAAGIAAGRGVEVHTIGVGDPQASGEDRVDFEALKTIAGETGGAFFQADDIAGLEAVYQRIDELAPAEVKTESWRPRTSLVHWLLLGVLLLAGGVMLVQTRQGAASDRRLADSTGESTAAPVS